MADVAGQAESDDIELDRDVVDEPVEGSDGEHAAGGRRRPLTFGSRWVLGGHRPADGFADTIGNSGP